MKRYSKARRFVIFSDSLWISKDDFDVAFSPRVCSASTGAIENIQTGPSVPVFDNRSQYKTEGSGNDRSYPDPSYYGTGREVLHPYLLPIDPDQPLIFESDVVDSVGNEDLSGVIFCVRDILSKVTGAEVAGGFELSQKHTDNLALAIECRQLGLTDLARKLELDVALDIKGQLGEQGDGITTVTDQNGHVVFSKDLDAEHGYFDDAALNNLNDMFLGNTGVGSSDAIVLGSRFLLQADFPRLQLSPALDSMLGEKLEAFDNVQTDEGRGQAILDLGYVLAFSLTSAFEDTLGGEASGVVLKRMYDGDPFRASSHASYMQTHMMLGFLSDSNSWQSDDGLGENENALSSGLQDPMIVMELGGFNQMAEGIASEISQIMQLIMRQI